MVSEKPIRKVSEKLQAYRDCISKGMTGKSFPNIIERRKAFCQLASLCSGKSKTVEEAAEKCKSRHPEWFK